MRILPWLGVVFVTSCRYLVSFDGFADDSGSAPPGGGSGGTSVDAGNLPTHDGNSDANETGARIPELFQDRSAVGGTPMGLTVWGNEIFWAEVGPPGILRAPVESRDGSAILATYLDQALAGTDPFDVAIDGTTVYWSQGSSVRYAPLDSHHDAGGYGAFNAGIPTHYLAIGPAGSALEGIVLVTSNSSADPDGGILGYIEWFRRPSDAFPLRVGPGRLAGIALCNGWLYWARGGADIERAQIGFDQVNGMVSLVGEPSPIVQNQTFVSGVACDDQNLYWLDDRGSVHCIDLTLRVPTLVCENPSTADGGASSGDIAVDARTIYFTDPASHRIYKVAKPSRCFPGDP